MFLGRSGQFLSLTSHSPNKHHAGFQYHQHAVSMENLILLNFLTRSQPKKCHLLSLTGKSNRKSDHKSWNCRLNFFLCFHMTFSSTVEPRFNEAQGTGQMCSLYQGFVISRVFFSMYFTITGAKNAVLDAEVFVKYRFVKSRFNACNSRHWTNLWDQYGRTYLLPGKKFSSCNSLQKLM